VAPRAREALSRIHTSDGGQRLLDVGCYGQWIGAYVNLLGYRDVTGIAHGEDAGLGCDMPVKMGSRDFKLRSDFFDIETDSFPYDDESFDVVVCCEVLEHLVRDPMQVMSEINRVVKIGGQLVFQTPNSASLRTMLRTIAGLQPYSYSVYHGVGVDRHNREFTTAELVRLIENSGFSVKTAETFRFRKTSWLMRLAKVLTIPAAIAGKCPLGWRNDVSMVVAEKVDGVLERWPSWLYSDPWFIEPWYRKHGGPVGQRRLTEWQREKTAA
jgi:2-polyprenyl-3-methyl-5-hydroxy-6-metoxy-1,4-benzoquinol methylase